MASLTLFTDRSGATFSADRVYRYTLHRRWSPGPVVVFLMLNPSTADERVNDPTVERCERRARALGAGGIVVVNLFALRATDPAALYGYHDPIGPFNDAAILSACRGAAQVACAWGRHGQLDDRAAHVLRLLRAAGVQPQCLGVNKDGSPKHPLYVPYTASMVPFPCSKSIEKPEVPA